jgi:hypothetical protein
MIDHLSAAGADAGAGEELDLYAWLIGSWEIEATWFEEGRAVRTGQGEWHFGWILGGRAIQDVLFAKGAQPHAFGTTLRCYDAREDTWHIVWSQPASGEFAHLLGRRSGSGIVQQSVAGDGARTQRWSFDEITDRSFRWRGEVSPDGGNTWMLELEMRATRRPATP